MKNLFTIRDHSAGTRLEGVYFGSDENNQKVLWYLQYKKIIRDPSTYTCVGSIRKGFVRVYLGPKLIATIEAA